MVLTERVHNGADFLRRLSIADAKVLLERTKKEKENKNKDMQKMISVRYRDLIESADKIINMHSAALRLEMSLKEMPDMWKKMEQNLTGTLAIDDQRGSFNEDETVASFKMPQSSVPGEVADANGVAYLVEASEEMWQLLDAGELLQALDVYQLAMKVQLMCVAKAAESDYPFLQAQWTCIQSFQSRMKLYARKYLNCRGKSSRFYASNLCILAVLNDLPIEADALFEIFLESRFEWIKPFFQREENEKMFQENSKKTNCTLMIMLKSIGMTMTQTEDIFGNGSESGLLSSIVQLSPDFKKNLAQFISSGKLLQRFSSWFQQNRHQILRIALPIILRINSISQLSRLQFKLNAVDHENSGYHNSKLWGQILSTNCGCLEKHIHASAKSVFSILFADAFRKQTRNFVQQSFIEALDEIVRQIHASLNDAAANALRSEYRLQNVKFYNYFENIYAKTADLDASDLQSVLIEEFLRTIVKLVVFFEQEYPLSGGKVNAASDSIQVSIFFFGISNILAGIVTEFHCHMDKLFPGSSSDVSIHEDVPHESKISPIFDKNSLNGLIMKAQLSKTLEEILGSEDKDVVCFIDEELERMKAVGFYSLYLISEIKLKASYPQQFVSVLHRLSTKYCEAWAAIVVEQKIEPLRELMAIEQYGMTNEEWIASHEGWTRQVIAHEDLDGDLEDSASECEMTLGEEKVWLPWCETPAVSSFLFSCCFSLDDANRMIQHSIGAKARQVIMMQRTIREALLEQVTIASVAVYDAAVSLLVNASANKKESVLNFGECCIQQFLFDMYFIRAALGIFDFVRFGWGDELKSEEISPSLLKLLKLFARMREFIDPVDWEIYGPQLIENVVLQFRRSRLLFSSLSASNDINKISKQHSSFPDGKELVLGAQDKRSLARIAEPVSRFSLLPVPSNRRKFQRATSRSKKY
ncbi:hypothetical protein CCR75_001220 [Bremia lactucae]|uniref:Conserved oligomeric Golgi complex subunit 1 n=1 Tax=Bremia lactucae TaxID=4779 RepID=A0A976IGJ4_BRELC|nr:hypothetical protein CCR75_001220 [Bremia lactucae]